MHKITFIEEYELSNREKSHIINKSKFWCNGCDSTLVGEIGKCPICGKVNAKGNRIKNFI